MGYLVWFVGRAGSLAVNKHLEAALWGLRSRFECRLGLKVWIDGLCINQADLTHRNIHVLPVKDIFGGVFCMKVWMKNDDEGVLPGFND